ncbi:MAG: nitronate monooxygenase [Sciscionella sp.]|nr:nitronate monooxygenase [Sciscionella sp.]
MRIEFLEDVAVPVIVAPMAGGVSTPELISAVTNSGGFGFLPAGYLSVDAFAERLRATRALTAKPFGVNLFVPTDTSTVDISGYVREMRVEAGKYGVTPGDPHWDDDEYPAKLSLAIAEKMPVVSFTFGLPSAVDVQRLRAAGSVVIVTVTSVDEARLAVRAGADALCVQGIEAGGHRGGWLPEHSSDELFSLLHKVSEVVDVPLIATGGIGTGADVAAVLSAGAVAAQCGTAFLRCHEAGTKPAHRAQLAAGTRDTTLTRAFTGRRARGLANRFTMAHIDAPEAYPQLHHLTAPIRAAGDPEAMSMWAGTAYRQAKELPATEVLSTLTP